MNKEPTLEQKVEVIKEVRGINHSAYKQAVMHLNNHINNRVNCDGSVKWCDIEFEYQSALRIIK
jgi:hypothetical protein